MINEEFGIRHIFGLKVKELRLRNKMSFQELAKQTGLSVSYLNEIEKGKKYPKGDKIMSLAGALNVTYDHLVSLKVSKKLQPIVNLLHSNFFKEFPLELFGLDAQKLVELISNSPEKINAFVGSIIQLARQYEMGPEEFYQAALRSYQEMHDNYFAELEQAVHDCKKKVGFPGDIPVKTSSLEELLQGQFGISVDREALAKHAPLKHLRSYYHPDKKCLLLNQGLTMAQQNFLIAREIAFQYLELEDRPRETPPQNSYNFDQLLNNYQASYFAAAFLIDEKKIVNDVSQFAKLPIWDGNKFLDFLDHYQATAEMLMQRLTNILPKYFGFNNLFFLRFLGTADFTTYSLTKELHLSRLHNPHANELNAHYCNRWVSISILKKLRSHLSVEGELRPIAKAQISRYYGTNDEYLCLSIAIPNVSDPREGISLTVGFLMDSNLRSKIKFLDDKNIRTRVVNNTCESCDLIDCEERLAPPYKVDAQRRKQKINETLALLGGS